MARRARLLVVVAGVIALFACDKKRSPSTPTSAAAVDAATATEPSAPLPELAALRCPGEKEDAGGTAGTFAGPVDAPVAADDADPGGGACPPESNGSMCDERETPLRKNDVCGVANINVRSAARDVAAGSGAPTSVAAVDARVLEHLDLNAEETERLNRVGFAVADRLRPGGYAQAYHAIFQEQLPVFVTVDSIFHAIFIANDTLTGNYEMAELWPRLVRSLHALRRGVGRGIVRAAYGTAVEADVDIYLRAGWSLLVADTFGADDDASFFGAVPAAAAHRADAEALVEKAMAASELVQDQRLFGRARAVDFTQFRPRGRYTVEGGLPGFVDLDAPSRKESERRSLRGTPADYFRGAMWLSRIEMNLVSRGAASSSMIADPAQTPHEARVALALSHLIRETKQTESLAFVQRAWDRLAGPREDVPLLELANIAREAKIAPADADPVPKLSARIGSAYRRSVRTHVSPEGTELPVITTLLGPRIARDTQGATRLVHDAVPDRHVMHATDFAYLLGNDRAKSYMTADLHGFPALAGKLDEARALASKRESHGPLEPVRDVYDGWLGAVRALSAKPPKDATLPSFMRSDAYADLRLDSTIVAFGQLRHNFVLMSAQPYDTYGCEIPDGWVEPAVEVYDELLRYADALADTLAPTDKAERARHDRYIAKVKSVLHTLRTISKHELEGKALTPAERRWLSLVAEHVPLGGYGGDSSGPPSYTGWYFDFFPDHEHDAKAPGDFVSDVYTSVNAKKILYLGAGGPRLGVFRVDVGGAPRLMIGPVATGYEHIGELGAREHEDLTGKGSAPWSRTYTASAPPEPDVAFQTRDCGDGKFVVRATAAARVEGAHIRLLDHHGDTIAAKDATLAAGATDLAFTIPKKSGFVAGSSYVEGIAVRAGQFRGVAGATVYLPQFSAGPQIASYQPTETFAFGRMRKAVAK